MKTNDLLITRPTKAVPHWGIHQMEKNGNVTVISMGGRGFTRKEIERHAFTLALPFKSSIYIQTRRGNRVILVPAHIMELQATLNEHVSRMKAGGITINLGAPITGRPFAGPVTGRIHSVNHIELRERVKQ